MHTSREIQMSEVIKCCPDDIIIDKDVIIIYVSLLLLLLCTGSVQAMVKIIL